MSEEYWIDPDPVNKLKEEIIDITGDFDFSFLQLKKANAIDSFYYFFNESNSSFCSIFILDDKPQVQRRCKVTLIESSDNKLIPRFEFFTWDKIADTKKDETNNKPFKARVQLDGDSSKNLWKLIAFLTTIKDIDLNNFSSYKIVDSDSYISKFKDKEEFEKVEELKKIFSVQDLKESSINKALFIRRKDIVEKFKKMLEDNSEIEKYRTEYQINYSGDEAIWHHFFKNNDWLLGFNIDIKFINEFINEVNVGIPNTEGCGSPKSDLVGISDYTTLVELKTSETKFFTENKKNTARTNTWSFTDHFIDGISQCLGQKFDWDKKHESKYLVNNNQTVIDQNCYRTVDPKIIFIIGNKQKELPFEDTSVDIIFKKDTLERFRRNNRNIEIMSFDELYERAYFMVYGEKASKLNFVNNNNEEEVKIENIPF